MDDSICSGICRGCQRFEEGVDSLFRVEGVVGWLCILDYLRLLGNEAILRYAKTV
uniref:Uncharacterized protein n=1 Tax=Candidatus Kentrum sp. TUN TaxID=2126343 RepID=A0A450ZSJ2_9GAMM|nr:MAG: hypothetical protein BECKTUN1418D_GA0071000_105216 [Candidatus Kentron sp. TUN]